ncbi:MAG: HD domain-containing protein [Culicoidibacterales bacterium]
MLRTAIEFARLKHLNQYRKSSGRPNYISHLFNVLERLQKISDNQNLHCAGMLHDTIEDTDTTDAELRSLFGDEIADLVLELTDDKSLEKHVRKQIQIDSASAKSELACYICIADKLDNCTSVVFDPPHDWDIERRKQYMDWAGKCIYQYRFNKQEMLDEFEMLDLEFDKLYRLAHDYR